MLVALTHLTKAEIASLREGPHLPGGTVLHDLVYGYAVGASLLFFLMLLFYNGYYCIFVVLYYKIDEIDYPKNLNNVPKL